MVWPSPHRRCVLVLNLLPACGIAQHYPDAIYFETNPAGFPRLVIVIGELIDPLVVFKT